MFQTINRRVFTEEKTLDNCKFIDKCIQSGKVIRARRGYLGWEGGEIYKYYHNKKWIKMG